MTDHAAMKARAEQAFTHHVAPSQIIPGPDEPVHLARRLAADVLELLAALEAAEAERDYAIEHCAEAEYPTARPCVQRAVRLQARVTMLEAALNVIPPDRLALLADWLDVADDVRGVIPDAREVQADLRRMATAARAAFAKEACAVPGCGRQRTSHNRWCQECNEAAPPPPALAKEDTDE